MSNVKREGGVSNNNAMSTGCGGRLPECTQVFQAPTVGRYVFCSSPKPVPTVRPGYRNAIEKPRGAHDYYNMMWDPHVYRGDSFKTFKQAEQDRCEAAEKAEERKRRRRARTLNKYQTKVGGIARPFTPNHPNDKKRSMESQTMKFLKEFIEEPIALEEGTQTDMIGEVPDKILFRKAKVGQDGQTQIHSWELFIFDEEVKPIVDTLVVKVLEQSLLETMEEQELDSLKEQENGLEETRRQELMRLQRLRARQQEVRLQHESIATEYRQEILDMQALEKTIGIVCCSKSYINGMIVRMMENFRREGYFSSSVADDAVVHVFIPWLDELVEEKVSYVRNSYDLVSDIVKTVVETREANIVNDVVPSLPHNPPTTAVEEYGGE